MYDEEQQAQQQAHIQPYNVSFFKEQCDKEKNLA